MPEKPDEKPTIVYVVRHFPTKLNENPERLRGWLNAPIDKTESKRLGAIVGKMLADAGVDCLYCSTLQRGRETAKAIERFMPEGTEIEIRAGFNTWDTGKFTGEPKEDVWKRIENYIKNPEIKVPGDERFAGESFGSFVKRWTGEVRHQIKDAVKRESEKTDETGETSSDGRLPRPKNAWIIHGNEFWTLAPILEGRDPELADHDSPATGSVFRLEMTPKDFTLVPVWDSEEDEERDAKGVS